MAPPASALAVARAFRDDLLACGVPQVSIELQIGRSGRWVSTGSHGGTSFVACLGHHIASFPSASNPTPGLGVVKNGRPGLNGPLCNAYGGMDLIARIICLDWANHPGEGGPWTIDGVRIPRDGGRPYLLGWEHEGGFSTAVWDATYTNRATGRRMTYREFMGRCHAGTLRFLGRPRTSFGEHSTWADLKQIGRKIDRLGYGHPVGGAAVKGINELTPYYLGQQPSEDDMPLNPDDAKTVWTGYTITSGPQKGDAPITALAEAATFSLDARNRAGQVLAIQTRMDEKLTALLAAQAGENTGEIMERIDAHHAEVLAQFEAAEMQRREMKVLVEQALSGDRDATETLRALRDLIDAAITPAAPTTDT